MIAFLERMKHFQQNRAAKIIQKTWRLYHERQLLKRKKKTRRKQIFCSLGTNSTIRKCGRAYVYSEIVSSYIKFFLYEEKHTERYIPCTYRDISTHTYVSTQRGRRITCAGASSKRMLRNRHNKVRGLGLIFARVGQPSVEERPQVVDRYRELYCSPGIVTSFEFRQDFRKR